MKSKIAFMIVCCFLGLGLALSQIAVARQEAPAGAGAGAAQNFKQPAPEREVNVTAIPGVIAAGAKWKLVWQGPDNADGLVGTSDGGILFAQEQPSTVGRLDPHDKFSIWARDTHGTGALGMNDKGVIGVERTCSDPGGHPDQCHEAAQLILITPPAAHQDLADNYMGKTFWRMGELICDSKGGVYFSDDFGTYFVDAKGKVSLVAGKDVRTNGMMLSRDEKTLYLTNGKTIVTFDVQPDGTTANQRDWATLQGGAGDGMAIDNDGRIYVTTGDPGIQVFSPEGKYLGVIPLPRSSSSIAFAGPDKKTLYGKGAGMKTPDGQEYRTPDGVRNNAKAIYKIDMIAQGYTGRPK
jgi:gluconolactonase